MDYSYESILLNQRSIYLDVLEEELGRVESAFERSALLFLHGWLSGSEEFTLHTSGSTGSPKPVTLTRHSMRRSALRTIAALGLQENDSALVCLNTEYIAGKMMLVRALEGNMHIVAVEPSSNPFEKLSDNQPVDFMAVVPLQLETIVSFDEGIERLNRMKAIIVGGAVISENLKRQIEPVQTPVFATYGMTETISHVALQLLNTANHSEYFTTLPGVKIGQDDRGCLVIDDEILNAPVVTNDLVHLHSSTQFKWLGRADHVINTGGAKVSPERIEQQAAQFFSQIAMKRRFFVAGFPHSKLGQEVVLLIEGNPLPQQTELELLTQLKNGLSPFERPKRIRYIRHFEYTATGKINRVKTIESAKD